MKYECRISSPQRNRVLVPSLPVLIIAQQIKDIGGPRVKLG